MKKGFPVLLFFLTCSVQAFSLGAWTQKADFGGSSRYGAAGFSIGGKAYTGTGMDGAVKKDFWEWDRAANVWTQKADFGGAGRYSAVGFSIGTKGYIGTGMDASSTRRKDFWEWDQTGNTWTQKADFGGTAREGAVGFSIGAKGYIGTGQESSTVYKKDFWEWDQAGNTWTQKANFGGTVRSAAAGFSMGGKGYIGTGIDGAGSAKQDFWEWDPAGNSWTQKANFGGAARFGAVGFCIGSLAYIGTGRDGALAYKKDFWEWGPVNNSWAQITAFGGTARNGSVGFSLGNRVYVCGGYDGTYKKDFWEWNTLPSVLANGASTVCAGICNGTATVTVSGGTLPYSYFWSNSETTASPTGLCAGSNTITVVDADSDTATAVLTVDQHPVLTSSVTSTAVSCFGGNNGTAVVSPAGGAPSFAYLWNTGETTAQVSGLIAQVYSVTVTDGNNCTSTSSVTITEPPLLSTGIVSQTNILCTGGNGGSAIADASGGTPAYTYLWDNGQSSSSATGLSAGNYTITVTDGNGCTASTTVTISEPAALTLSVTSVTATCLSANGSAGVVPGGGSPAYTYSWANGGTTASITGLYAGTYSVTLTDANGCTQASFANVTNVGGDSVAITGSVNVSCYGGSNGSASCAIMGTNTPHTYSWNSSPVQTTSSATGLAAGIYNITITDAAGCVDIATITIAEPLPIAIAPSATDVKCNGGNDGAVAATVAGGTPAYTYLWSSGESTSAVSGLTVGTYTLTVTDSLACVATNTVSVTEPAILTATITAQNNLSCNGSGNGSATAAGSGGTAPFTYLWNTAPAQTTSTATALGPGTFSVTITDRHGCANTTTATITEPGALTVTTATVSPICPGTCATLSASATGGSGGYTYLWMPGSLTGMPAVVCPVSSTGYTMSVTDSAGCRDTGYTSITVNPLPAVTLVLDPDTVCIDAPAYPLSGGTPAGGTYSGAAGVIGGSFDASAAGPGTHTVIYTYTDANGCTGNVTDSIFVDLCTGMPGALEERTVLLYPNPGAGLFYADVKTAAGAPVSLRIFDVLGENACSLELPNGHTEIYLSGRAKGIYFYQILLTGSGTGAEEIISSGKLIIQ